jgi:hypothetical protein
VVVKVEVKRAVCCCSGQIARLARGIGKASSSQLASGKWNFEECLLQEQ